MSANGVLGAGPDSVIVDGDWLANLIEQCDELAASPAGADTAFAASPAGADTASSDTASADTASADTASADTASADTASADTLSCDFVKEQR